MWHKGHGQCLLVTGRLASFSHNIFKALGNFGPVPVAAYTVGFKVVACFAEQGVHLGLAARAAYARLTVSNKTLRVNEAGLLEHG